MVLALMVIVVRHVNAPRANLEQSWRKSYDCIAGACGQIGKCAVLAIHSWPFAGWVLFAAVFVVAKVFINRQLC
jgi:hypothetical protein